MTCFSVSKFLSRRRRRLLAAPLFMAMAALLAAPAVPAQAAISAASPAQTAAAPALASLSATAFAAASAASAAISAPTAAVSALPTAAPAQAAVSAASPAQAASPVVVVLDPGHGGPEATSDNLGAQYPPYSEQSLTLELARRIQTELAQYEGVAVCLTRSDNTAATLAQRAALAQSADADLLVSLHFNASGSHLFYGSEVWTSAFGSNYAVGASFGRTALAQLQGLGFYSRGVKTRIGARGDYYGVIREAAARNVPAVIVEHCYLDNENDRSLLSVDALARADAAAIAQYFRLRAKSGTPDYGSYLPPAVSPAPAAGLAQDVTPPELCRLELLSVENGLATLRLTARDSDTVYPVLYYRYIVNGVSTPLLPYSQSAGSAVFTVPVPAGQTVQVSAAAVNAYELESGSNVVTVR